MQNSQQNQVQDLQRVRVIIAETPRWARYDTDAEPRHVLYRASELEALYGHGDDPAPVDFVTDGERYGILYEDGYVDWLAEGFWGDDFVGYEEI